MKFVSGLVLSCLLVGPAVAQIDATTARLVYKEAGAERALTRNGQAFTTTDGHRLLFDSYSPPVAAGRKPAVIFVSGTEDARTWPGFQDFGRVAAARGFVGLVPTKRYPRGVDGTRLAALDTRDFVEYVAKNSGALGVDPDKICLWVISGGAPTAAVAFLAGNPPVRCLVVYYGPLDASGQIPAGRKMAPAMVAEFSPLHALQSQNARQVPTFIVRAGRDRPFLNEDIDAFIVAALKANLPLRLTNYPEGEHAFDIVNDTDDSRRIIADTFEFLKAETAPR